MKILIYGINFSPELTGIGKYTGEMAFWLASKGHDVRVIASPPYYPMWKVADGYSGRKYAYEQVDGISIWRIPTWVPKKQTGLNRIIHLVGFSIASFPVLIRQVFWRPNVIWLAVPAFSCAPGVLLAKLFFNPKTWIHIQDYEIDAAFNMGLIKGNLLKKIISNFERFLLKKFDVVSSISDQMIALAIKKGVAPNKLVSLPNWVDFQSTFFTTRSASAPQNLRREFGIPADQLVALYSGNIGNKQGMELISNVAKLAEKDNILFVICGDGAGKKSLVDECTGLLNVLFFPLQPREKLGALLSMADIHLLPQRDNVADLVMPSKLTGIFASGRPVIATAKGGSSLEMIISGCGLVVPPNSPCLFYDALIKLTSDAELRNNLGLAARKFAEVNLDKEIIMENFNTKLSELVGYNL